MASRSEDLPHLRSRTECLEPRRFSLPTPCSTSRVSTTWLPLVLAIALLFVSHPLTWFAWAQPPLWSPVAGLALVLVAWFGNRLAVLAVAGATTLLLVQHGLAFAHRLPREHLLLWIFSDGLWTILEATGTWALYSNLAKGHRRLVDPRSATQFVLLVGGLSTGLAGLLRLLTVWLLDRQPLAAFVQESGSVGWLVLFLAFWLDRALGVLVLAPPLLVLGTAWLKQRGWLPVEHLVDQQGTPNRDLLLSTDPFGQILPGAGGDLPHRGDSRSSTQLGDWLEVAGLAMGSTLLCLILSHYQELSDYTNLQRREVLIWPLWGVQILLIGWASLRQGLSGGTIVATSSAGLALLSRQLWPNSLHSEGFYPFLQAHLLAQCSAALLVSAAASWVRMHETGYRQVVSAIPVVIYSVRLHSASAATPFNDAGVPQAEVTLVSAASLGLLGVPAEQLLGDYSRWLSCIHADDQVVVLAALEQLSRQDQPVVCEYRLARTESATTRRRRVFEADGSPISPIDQESLGSLPKAHDASSRWVRDTLAPHRDSSGRLLGWQGILVDITEQRHLADDLRRTTNMLHALVANLPTGVFFVQGVHGQPILVNTRARTLLGQREDLSASLEQLSEVYRLFRPDGTPYPVEQLPLYLALREGRTTMRDDIVVHHPDGRHVPLITWGAPVHLGLRGQPDAAVWVLEDRTALHQAEAAQRDTESRLHAIIETMAESLLVHDANGRIVSSNLAAVQFFGRTAESMAGKTLLELDQVFLREDGRELPLEEHPVYSVLRTGRPVRNVVLGLRKLPPRSSSRTVVDTSPLDETVRSTNVSNSASLTPSIHSDLPDAPTLRWVLVNAMPLGSTSRTSLHSDETQPEGSVRPVGVVVTYSDLSSYFQARQAIRISEERYRGLVESLPVLLLQTDRSLRITYANPAAVQHSGYSLSELSDPTIWSQWIHPEDQTRLLDLLYKALAGQHGQAECRYLSRTGAEKVAFVLCQPREQQGSIVGTSLVLLDITRERQLERELHRAQRLELIGQLSSGVAHDFNNLLGVVLNLTDLARSHLPPDHPVYADLRRISQAGEQAVQLASQLLALSKHQVTKPHSVDLNAVLQRGLDLLRASLPPLLILEVDLHPGELSVLLDETQAQQVLMNLCLNARDAMPRGGTLRVSTRCVSLPQTSRPHAQLTVEDTGHGMSEAVRVRIFDPFFTTKERGTGLGLAVVRQIVEAFGGHIQVASSPGKGTRFDIYWPLHRVESSPSDQGGNG